MPNMYVGRFILDMKALVRGMEDDFLSPDDFMSRAFEFYQQYERNKP